ncbi:MAG: hypothetical protein ACK5D5_10160 [Bacteroidota bacterium]|jgi:hypothetical protein
MKKYFFFLLVFIFSKNISSQSIWTIGPMLHVNFGDSKTRCSWNLEAAYWNFSGFPWSVDMALEFEKQKFRFYSEIQTGVGVAGLSSGPVLEFNREEHKLAFGWQASVWGNYYWGFDLRYRRIGDKSFFAPGTYLKVAFNGRDKYGNPTKSSGGDFDLDD